MASEYTRDTIKITDAYLTPTTIATGAQYKAVVTVVEETETIYPLYPFSGVPFYSGEGMYSGG